MRLAHLIALLPVVLVPVAIDPAGAMPSQEDPPRRQRAAEDEPPPAPAPFLPEAAYCERGRRLLDDDRPSTILEARTIYRAAIADHPDSACAHAGLARALAAIIMQRVEEDDTLIDAALVSARRGVDLDADSAEARASLARALLLDLQPLEADEAARASIAREGAPVYAFLTAALVFTMTRQNADAHEAVARALERAPHLATAYLAQGNLSLIEGNEWAAAASFKRALTLSPDYLPALLQLGVALEGMGDLRGSADAMRTAIDRHPEAEARANLFMAISLMRRGGWEEALTILDRIDFRTSRGPGRGTVAWYRGFCLEKMGRPAEARQAYRDVIDHYPDATAGYGGERLVFRCYEALGRMAMEEKDFEAAAGIMEEGASRTRASIDLMLRLARLYGEYNLPDQGAALLERSVSRPLEQRTAQVHLESYIEWARFLRRIEAPDARDRLSASLARQTEALRRIDQRPRDLDAMRALSIVGAGAEALDWLRWASDRGYAYFGWIEGDPELESLRRAPGYGILVGRTPPVNAPND